ncbi:VWA domain-containing protein [Candidatus Woesearchaeota archaeon]|nr:VWA domain-containing protein [Candidatus Woesearchaeota archaeon]MBT5271848.1 VWA domain-containing protein [Candidatus Woesearchaeota archaeon]MBT6041688.1 VWA domain-containing protein [Candidatus Woesearchaeota archaeon]MBT6337336.1 VWA domain-containing protein [Candidatus Woesearchaeota archaeon]MBT7927584.1 VWA domain-containing protein [Candidatus Woesearchaeota archaeon]
MRRKARCQGDKSVDKLKKGKKAKVKKTEPSFEQKGKPGKGSQLMNSIMENDKKTIDNGKLIMGALTQGITSFAPDLMMEKFVDNYKLAKNIYGESLIKYFSGYDPRYIEKNIKIPEFQRELAGKMESQLRDLKAEGIIDKNNTITDEGIQLAGLILYTEEIDNLTPKGVLGERFHKKNHIYGSKTNTKIFRKSDRYRDVALKRSIKTAIRRGHSSLKINDLKSFERQAKGKVYVVYALDSSGSMKGEKLVMCKKAGISLAFKAIEEKDKVGLMVFGKEIKQEIMPTDDFLMLLKEISVIKATSETDFGVTIKRAINMFPAEDVTKHLLILTDALPTVGKDPQQETLDAANIAAANGITISVVGINLDKPGKILAKKLAETGNGKLYVVKDVKEIDKIVLQDYYSL